jgi:translocation and assembly module TamB
MIARIRLSDVNLGELPVSLPFSTLLNGDLKLAGSRTGDTWTQAGVSGVFKQSRIETVPFDSLAIDAVYRLIPQWVEWNLFGQLGQGKLTSMGSYALSNPDRGLKARVGVDGLDLQSVLPESGIEGMVNLNGSIQGAGDPYTVAIKGRSSHVQKIEVDSLFCQSRLYDNQIIIDSCWTSLEPGRVRIQGAVSPPRMDLTYQVEIDSLSGLNRMLDGPALDGSGTLWGTVNGTVDAPEMSTRLMFESVEFDSFTADSVSGSGSFTMMEETPFVRSRLQIGGFRSEFMSLEYIDTRAHGWIDSSFVRVDVSDSVLTGALQAGFRSGSAHQIRLDSLAWTAQEQTWMLQKPASVQIESNRFSVDSLRIESDDQLLFVHGRVDRRGALDALVRMDRFQIGYLGRLFAEHFSYKGILNVVLTIRGEAQMPQITGEVTLAELKARDADVGRVQLMAELVDTDFKVNGNWLYKQQPIDIQAHIPLTFRLDPFQVGLEDRQLWTGSFKSQDFDLSVLSDLVPDIQRSGGRMTFDLQGRYQSNRPRVQGQMSLERGRLQLDRWGVDVFPISLSAMVEDTVLHMDTFDIQKGDGRLRLSGDLDIRNLLPRARRISPSVLKWSASQFRAVSLPGIEVTATGSGRLSGQRSAIQFQGDVEIDRSRVKLKGLQPGTSQPARPLLVRDRMDTVATSRNETKLDTDSDHTAVQGRLSLRIPRNTWIQSPDINMELSGRLELVKSAGPFELFGTIETIRGTFEFYGKRFEIEEGMLTFSGGPRFNPNLNIRTQYTFRSVDEALRELTLRIGGTMEEPRFSFSLDGQNIEQTNAVSYLLFGRSMDELTHGQKSELSSQTGTVNTTTVQNILAGQLANQLTSELRQQLDLDVIEFRGDQNWRQATVAIGKYLTNNLYVHYERSFSFKQTNQVVPEQVRLEYRLGHSWFLQAMKGSEKNTGFDLIWKWEQE